MCSTILEEKEAGARGEKRKRSASQDVRHINIGTRGGLNSKKEKKKGGGEEGKDILFKELFLLGKGTFVSDLRRKGGRGGIERGKKKIEKTGSTLFKLG